jgi:hypothetical protein
VIRIRRPGGWGRLAGIRPALGIAVLLIHEW